MMNGPRASSSSISAQHGVSLPEAFRVWLKIALLSFGGPAGQIALMHRILVEEKKWISGSRFLHALNYCMILPGPEAQQLATYIGWLMHGTRGGLMAGLLFILPGIIAIMALSLLYVTLGQFSLVAGLFFGLKAAVLAIVIQAIVRVGRRALRAKVMWLVAACAFVALFLFGVPFPLIILTAGLAGACGASLGWPDFLAKAGHAPLGKELDSSSLLGDRVPDHAHRAARDSLKVAAIWLALWLAPVIILVLALGENHVFSLIGVFFSKMAIVTFGGAYAVLAYVAQQAVQGHHWLSPSQMLDGLGMAETTPGPLIMVLQYVGFLGAYYQPGSLTPILAGALGGLLATWVTFCPCFLWIFLGAPYIEHLRGNRVLDGALSAITAAVVGVILNLSLWFGIHALFGSVQSVQGFGLSLEVPVWASLNVWALALSGAAALAIFRFKAGVPVVLAGSALAGMVLFVAGIV